MARMLDDRLLDFFDDLMLMENLSLNKDTISMNLTVFSMCRFIENVITYLVYDRRMIRPVKYEVIADAAKLNIIANMVFCQMQLTSILELSENYSLNTRMFSRPLVHNLKNISLEFLKLTMTICLYSLGHEWCDRFQYTVNVFFDYLYSDDEEYFTEEYHKYDKDFREYRKLVSASEKI